MTTIRLKPPTEKVSDHTTARNTYILVRTEILSCSSYDNLLEYIRIQSSINDCLEIKEAQEEQEYLEASDIDDQPAEAITDEIELAEEYHWEEEPNLIDQNVIDRLDYETVSPAEFIGNTNYLKKHPEIVASIYNHTKTGNLKPIADVFLFRGSDKQIDQLFETPDELILIKDFPFYLRYTPRTDLPYHSLKALAIKQEYEIYISRLYFYVTHLLILQKEFFKSSSLIDAYKKMITMPQRNFLNEVEENYGIPEAFRLDTSQLSRMFRNRYVITHLGIIPLNHFFPISRGKSKLNSIQILGYMLDHLYNDPDINDTNLAYKLKKFGISRSDIRKKREQILNIPSVRQKEIRHKLLRDNRNE